ncbi:hypothetical protein BDV40DRAFT_277000 [Aspergillus tamarii]|uniref:Secreted protein n=1 Tax=Aspergillus tamarii TaxID=41984 RepID=A0A5N6UHB0_ASPTM|nr:hypothetical protein BDV40DRAFT_277000 [Aspergillus tamarii]
MPGFLRPVSLHLSCPILAIGHALALWGFSSTGCVLHSKPAGSVYPSLLDTGEKIVEAIRCIFTHASESIQQGSSVLDV